MKRFAIAIAVVLAGCSTQTTPEGSTVQVVEMDTISAAVYQFFQSKQAQIDRALLNPALSPEQRQLLTAEGDRLNNQIASLVTVLQQAQGYQFVITIQVVPGDVVAAAPAKAAALSVAPPPVAQERAVLDEESPHADGTVTRTTRPNQ